MEFQEYLTNLPEDRVEAITNLRDLFKENLPKGFEERISGGFIHFVIPHSVYPNGYHCDTKQPLPFLSIASQKNFIAVYHMGIYANPVILAWFTEQYPKHCKTKLDMGKSCIRFKKLGDIPYQLLKELATKITVQEWINCYEENLLVSKK